LHLGKKINSLNPKLRSPPPPARSTYRTTRGPHAGALPDKTTISRQAPAFFVLAPPPSLQRPPPLFTVPHCGVFFLSSKTLDPPRAQAGGAKHRHSFQRWFCSGSGAGAAACNTRPGCLKTPPQPPPCPLFHMRPCLQPTQPASQSGGFSPPARFSPGRPRFRPASSSPQSVPPQPRRAPSPSLRSSHLTERGASFKMRKQGRPPTLAPSAPLRRPIPTGPVGGVSALRRPEPILGPANPFRARKDDQKGRQPRPVPPQNPQAYGPGCGHRAPRSVDQHDVLFPAKITHSPRWARPVTAGPPKSAFPPPCCNSGFFKLGPRRPVPGKVPPWVPPRAGASSPPLPPPLPVPILQDRSFKTV